MVSANPTSSDTPRFMDRGFFFILVALFAGALYTGFFFLWKTELLSDFHDDFFRLIIETQNTTVKELFEKYAIYGGVAFALLLIIKSMFLFGIKKIIWLGKKYILNPLFYIILYGGFTIFAWNIYYYEPHYSAIGIAIIYLVAKPMLYSSAIITGLMLLNFIWRLVKK